jgi:dipeptide/tripeptide permease
MVEGGVSLAQEGKMAAMTPMHWAILALIALLVLIGYGRIRAALSRLLGRVADSKRPQRRFFEGMTAVTSLALGGAMLLALGLLVDVYGPDWAPGAMTENVSLILSGSGGLVTLLALLLDRRSRKRQG